MNKFTACIFSVGLVAGAAQSAFAADAGSTDTKAPQCAAGDHVVVVDTKSKTYSMAGGNPGQSASAGESASQNTDKGSMAHSSDQSAAGKSAASPGDYTQMCKSKADAMGAKMAAKNGSLLNSKVGTGGSH